jgi:hypothetical protein
VLQQGMEAKLAEALEIADMHNHRRRHAVPMTVFARGILPGLDREVAEKLLPRDVRILASVTENGTLGLRPGLIDETKTATIPETAIARADTLSDENLGEETLTIDHLIGSDDPTESLTEESHVTDIRITEIGIGREKDASTDQIGTTMKDESLETGKRMKTPEERRPSEDIGTGTSESDGPGMMMCLDRAGRKQENRKVALESQKKSIGICPRNRRTAVQPRGLLIGFIPIGCVLEENFKNLVSNVPSVPGIQSS